MNNIKQFSCKLFFYCFYLLLTNIYVIYLTIISNILLVKYRTPIIKIQILCRDPTSSRILFHSYASKYGKKNCFAFMLKAKNPQHFNVLLKNNRTCSFFLHKKNVGVFSHSNIFYAFLFSSAITLKTHHKENSNSHLLNIVRNWFFTIRNYNYLITAANTAGISFVRINMALICMFFTCSY